MKNKYLKFSLWTAIAESFSYPGIILEGKKIDNHVLFDSVNDNNAVYNNINYDIYGNFVESDVSLNLAPASEIAYFYLQKSLNLTEETMWKIINQYGFILGLTVPNLKAKIKYLADRLQYNDEEIRVIVAIHPAILSLNVNTNVKPTIDFLEDFIDFSTEELRDIVLKCPSLLSYSIANLKQKLTFFRKTLQCSALETRALIRKTPQLITYSTFNFQEKLLFFMGEYIGSVVDKNDAIRIVKKAFLTNPRIFQSSLLSNIKPKYKFWKETLYFSSKMLVVLLEKYPHFLNYDVRNVQKLHQYIMDEVGLTLSDFQKIMLKSPRTITYSQQKIHSVMTFFKEEVKIQDETHLRRVILHAPQLLTLSVNSIRAKVYFLRQLISSSCAKNEEADEKLKKIIVGMPTLLLCSVEKNLSPKFSFLLGIFNNDNAKLIEIVVSKPTLLGYSLEKRIKPRVAKLAERNIDLHRICFTITYTEENFEKWLASEAQGKKKMMKQNTPNAAAEVVSELTSTEVLQSDGRVVTWTRPRKTPLSNTR